MATGYENLFGREGQSQAFSRFGPQHQQQNDTLIRDILSQLGTQTQQGFEPIENQARRDFQQKTLPTIGERFTSLGNGSLSSPAYQSQKFGSAIDLDTNLAALKSQYGLQRNDQLLSLLSQLAPNQAYFGRQPGAFENTATGALESLPQYLAAQRMGNKNQDEQQGEGTNWWDAAGNGLLALAPAGAAFGPPGLAAGAGAGLIGALLKYLGGRKSNSSQDAQTSPIQQQLMNQTPGNYNSQYNNLSFNQGGSQNSPLGRLDFSPKSPNIIKGALA